MKAIFICSFLRGGRLISQTLKMAATLIGLIVAVLLMSSAINVQTRRPPVPTERNSSPYISETANTEDSNMTMKCIIQKATAVYRKAAMSVVGVLGIVILSGMIACAVEHGYKELVRAKQKVPYIRVFLISVVQWFLYSNVFDFFASFRDVFYS
jgi:hypothetical protein